MSTCECVRHLRKPNDKGVLSHILNEIQNPERLNSNKDIKPITGEMENRNITEIFGQNMVRVTKIRNQ